MVTQETYKTVISNVRKQGIRVRQNVASCCRGCAELPEDKPLVWTFGGQGNATTWVSDKLYYRNEVNNLRRRYGQFTQRQTAQVKTLYFYFSEVHAAKVLVSELKTAGFNVEWDGTEHKAVLVHFS